MCAMGLFQVIARCFAAVWNVESSIDSHQEIKVDDDDFDGEIEDVETCFRKVFWWVVTRSRRHEVCPQTKGSAEAEKEG